MKSIEIRTWAVMALMAAALFLLMPVAGRANDCHAARQYYEKALNLLHDPADAAALAEKEILYKRAASSRNSFVYRPCGIFSIDDTSVLSPYNFTKLWCPFFSTYLI